MELEPFEGGCDELALLPALLEGSEGPAMGAEMPLLLAELAPRVEEANDAVELAGVLFGTEAELDGSVVLLGMVDVTRGGSDDEPGKGLPVKVLFHQLVFATSCKSQTYLTLIVVDVLPVLVKVVVRSVGPVMVRVWLGSMTILVGPEKCVRMMTGVSLMYDVVCTCSVSMPLRHCGGYARARSGLAMTASECHANTAAAHSGKRAISTISGKVSIR